MWIISSHHWVGNFQDDIARLKGLNFEAITDSSKVKFMKMTVQIRIPGKLVDRSLALRIPIPTIKSWTKSKSTIDRLRFLLHLSHKYPRRGVARILQGEKETRLTFICFLVIALVPALPVMHA
jgi:hypothetical protein